ncbi:MAG: AAC(3) family N-acetyltransferase [Anaerolineaceae bacterium]|nr:AAC(3) family N-acetyltransferase [Anaerolineaceae bacterium]
MVSFREFVNAFRELKLDHSQPVIVHASLSSVGDIRGGAETVLGALLTITKSVMAPTFTYKTMIIPETGPTDNAYPYGTGAKQNSMAEYFLPDMPADPTMGILSETVRKYPDAKRSSHPILSFAGINVIDALAAQSMDEPLEPIRVLSEENGTVLLIGVNHTVNTSIHYAEKLAGRKQFTRWALTPQGVRQGPGFGGCSDGFEQAAPHLEAITRTTRLGNAILRAISLSPLISILSTLIEEQPLALLCGRGDERCETVRRSVEMQLLGYTGGIEASP